MFEGLMDNENGSWTLLVQFLSHLAVTHIDMGQFSLLPLCENWGVFRILFRISTCLFYNLFCSSNLQDTVTSMRHSPQPNNNQINISISWAICFRTNHNSIFQCEGSNHNPKHKDHNLVKSIQYLQVSIWICSYKHKFRYCNEY